MEVAATPPWKVEVPVESTYIGPPVVAEPEISAVPATARLACGEVVPIPSNPELVKRKRSVSALAPPKLSASVPKARSPSGVLDA